VVAAGQGLERDQGRVVALQHADVTRRGDRGAVRPARDPLPAQRGPVEPVGELDPAERAAAVLERDEGGRAPV